LTVPGLIVFLGGVFGLRMLGGFALGGLLGESERWTRLLALLPLAIVAGVIAVQTFTIRKAVVFDARAFGVAVAALGSWRRWSLGLVIVLAATTTALIRQTGWG
jgi:hypothetical protein